MQGDNALVQVQTIPDGETFVRPSDGMPCLKLQPHDATPPSGSVFYAELLTGKLRLAGETDAVVKKDYTFAEVPSVE